MQALVQTLKTVVRSKQQVYIERLEAPVLSTYLSRRGRFYVRTNIRLTLLPESILPPGICLAELLASST
jgi:hypothetical protein